MFSKLQLHVITLVQGQIPPYWCNFHCLWVLSKAQVQPPKPGCRSFQQALEGASENFWRLSALQPLGEFQMEPRDLDPTAIPFRRYWASARARLQVLPESILYQSIVCRSFRHDDVHLSHILSWDTAPKKLVGV